MRAFVPIQPPKDTDPRIYNILRNLNAYLAQVDAGFANITRGTTPDGAGSPLGGSKANLNDYLFLPGRGGSESTPGIYNGQTVFGNVFFKPYTKLQANPGTVASWTSIGDFTATSDTIGGTTWASIPIQTSASVGEIIVLVLATDPGSGTFSAHHSTVTDSKGNTWVKRQEKIFNNTDSGGDGSSNTVNNSIWTCYVATALASGSDTLTATFSLSVVVASVTSHRFSVGGNLTISVASSTTSGEAGDGTPPPAGDIFLPPGSLTLSGLTSNPYLFIRASGSATWAGSDPPGYTASTNYTVFRRNGTGVNSAGTKVISYAEYRAFTGTGDSTDPTTAETYGVFANIFIALQAGTAATASTDVSEHIVEVKAARSVADLDGFCIRDAVADGRLFFDGSLLAADLNKYWTIPNWTGIPVVPTALGTSGYLMVSQGTSQPAWLSVTSAVPGAALSKADDTNVTLALTGSPTVALLAATTLSLGWTGILSLARGGTGSATPFRDDIFTLNDSNDTSKLAMFQLSGISTATTRTYTVPDVSATLLATQGTSIGQVIGTASHTGGAASTLVIENQVLIGNFLSGINFTSGRALDILHQAVDNVTVVRVNPDFTNLSGAASGTLSSLSAEQTGTPGYTSGSYTAIGLRGLIGTGYRVPVGVTCSPQGLVGQCGADVPSSNPGLISNSIGLRGIVTGPTNVMSGTGTGLIGIQSAITPGNAAFSTLAGLLITNQGGTSTGTFTNSFGVKIDSNWFSTCTITTHTGLLITAPTSGTITTSIGIRILGAAVFNRIQGITKFGADSNPVHFVDIAAGTTTVAPLKLTSGTSLTTAIAGCIEFTTDDFFATITTGTARKAFILDDGSRLTSGRIPIATTNGRLIDNAALTFATGTLTVTKIAATTLTGLLTFTDAINMAFNGTTGTKIGTATSQKIGFWNAGPVVQPTTAITAATFVANTSLIANDTATFDNYTIGQVVAALRRIGILA